jgi:hypothetical protein
MTKQPKTLDALKDSRLLYRKETAVDLREATESKNLGKGYSLCYEYKL